MIWYMGFDDKTSMVFYESHLYFSILNIKTMIVIFVGNY